MKFQKDLKLYVIKVNFYVLKRIFSFYNPFEKTPCLSRLGMNHAINPFHRTISRKYTLLKSVYFLIVREEGSCILKRTMNKQEYWIGAHTKYRLKYHIVFVPKYRKRILRGELVQTLKTLFYKACEVNDWYLEKLAIESDHIHMLLQCKPDKSLSQVVQILKG